MSEINTVIVVNLGILAISGLFVGVTNDADELVTMVRIAARRSV